jgi:hypothetical protein
MTAPAIAIIEPVSNDGAPLLAGAGAGALCDEWRSAARSTARCDRPAAEEAVRLACLAADVAVPERVVWMDSPAGAVAAVVVLQDAGIRFADEALIALRDLARGARHDDAVLDASGAAVQGGLLPLVREFRAELPDLFVEEGWAGGGRRGAAPARPPLRPTAVPRIREALAEQVGTRIADGAAVWAHLRYDGAHRADLRGRLGALVERAFAPHLVAHELARATRLLATAGRRPPPELAALVAAARSVGGWWPLDGIAVLSDRATERHLDRWGRLHALHGPALAFADGHLVHALSGVPVPVDLLEDDARLVQRILDQPNAEVRRVAIERYGWDRFLVDAAFVPVGGAQPDPGNPGRFLRLYDVPDEAAREWNWEFGRPVRFLVVTNASPDRDGTRRTFGLPVPANCPDALTAAALTFGIGAAEYAALDRAT